MSLVKTRLAAMMFLEYFIWGAWYVTVGTWLGRTQHFTGEQIGLVAGTTAVGAIVSPFLAGWLADRFFATQHVLAALHAAGAVLLFLASARTSFTPLYWLVLAYACCYMPTLALTNSLAFRQMRDPKQEFGPIRVLGTAGWIVAGLLVGGLKLEATALPLRLAAASSLVLAIYALTLPHTPPIKNSQGGQTQGKQAEGFRIAKLIPPEALRLLRQRSFAIFILAAFLICIPLQFYYAFTNLFLNEIGIHNAAGKMTGGQMSELFCMLLIPWFFRRLGVKYMLIAGMSAWALRYALFAFGNGGAALWMLYGGILLHGICYDFFFVTGQIYVDRKAPIAYRAAAQGMFTLITYGAGMLLGSWLSGRVVDRYATVALDGSATHAWRPIWLISASLSAAILVLFFFAFSDRESGEAAA
ncbi:MAG: nucleoside permease [Terracidiphilus sp.]|nr:nucleoside permease [Terracidiphilus sp.]MDR3775956.1 nucleoside permease [Terracidiphilus sp.]